MFLYVINYCVMKHEDFMRMAIGLAVENVKSGGGPFGAVIAKDGEVVATGEQGYAE